MRRKQLSGRVGKAVLFILVFFLLICGISSEYGSKGAPFFVMVGLICLLVCFVVYYGACRIRDGKSKTADRTKDGSHDNSKE